MLARAIPRILLPLAALTLLSCTPKVDNSAAKKHQPASQGDTAGPSGGKSAEFEYFSEQFADARILRYQVPGFEELELQEKLLVYYLYEAALSGRDIIYDQKYRHNLAVRRTLEASLRAYEGDREDPEFQHFLTYTKQVWFARGVHHDYSSRKFEPKFSKETFAAYVKAADPKALPLEEGEDAAKLAERLTPILFDPQVDARRVNRDAGADLITDSANNFYEGVNQTQVEAFYKKQIDPRDPEPISHGLNSKLMMEDGKLVEKTWKVGGMYGPAIKQIVYWLEKASAVAENEKQKAALDLLIEFYKTGDLRKFDEYNIAWVQDTDSRVDVVNGFIEVYGDAMGYRGTWESVVSIKDLEASKRIAAIAGQAQWFEDNAPIDDSHKKKDVVGISAKVITVVVEGGDAAPTTPIGINLPNANWIRTKHGSKSVNLGNIVHAYDEGKKGGSGSALEEFAASPEEVARVKKHGALAHTLHVDMHEVIGHASGRLNEGVGTTKETLKGYASALEEGRADLVGLYFVMDPKLVELGLMPDLDVGKAAYDNYIRNGLMVQLSRLELGDQIEESHMRNRQMVAAWAYEKGEADRVIERVERDGKTYFVINDYDKLRALFGELLKETQRIKSEGDYDAGKALIENYGVKVDPKLHEEVLERYASLGIAPYGGFIQPRLVPVKEGEEIVDVKIEYPDSFEQQMLEYSESYSFLPTVN
jgi:dipeptidyl-peptidase-3